MSSAPPGAEEAFYAALLEDDPEELYERDFYDVFETEPGSWGVALGDVCRKGAAVRRGTTAPELLAIAGTGARRVADSVVAAAVDFQGGDARGDIAVLAVTVPKEPYAGLS